MLFICLSQAGKEHFTLQGIIECFNTVNIVIKSQSFICLVLIMPINMNIQCSFVFTDAVFDTIRLWVDLRMNLPGTFFFKIQILFWFRGEAALFSVFISRGSRLETFYRPSFAQAA